MPERGQIMTTNAKFNEEPLLWNISTAQRLLGGIHRGTIDRLVRQGKLERVKIGRRSMITRQSAVALIQACRAT
jgi:hypothetical protein